MSRVILVGALDREKGMDNVRVLIGYMYIYIIYVTPELMICDWPFRFGKGRIPPQGRAELSRLHSPSPTFFLIKRRIIARLQSAD